MDERVFKKIQKCLALAESSNPNEAASALRQAQALMEKHGISDADVRLSNVEEFALKIGQRKTLPAHLSNLAALVSQLFGCRALVHRRKEQGRTVCYLRFIGIEPNAEICGYTYDVLSRQLIKDRAQYIKQLDFNRSKKTRMGDLFSMGWVSSVHSKIEKLVPNQASKTVIDEYLEKSRGQMPEHKPRQRKYYVSDAASFSDGEEAGNRAQIHGGVNRGGEAVKLPKTPA